MVKRIAIFSDGTWNTPGQAYPTNVIRLHDLTLESGDDGVAQARFYDRGVGADGNRLQRILGGASGRGLNQNILDGYRFLVETHEEGDQIFLFGFSRGAVNAVPWRASGSVRDTSKHETRLAGSPISSQYDVPATA